MSYPARRYSDPKNRPATGPQVSYLRILLHKAFAAGLSSNFDVHHLDRITVGEASAEISRLKDALK